MEGLVRCMNFGVKRFLHSSSVAMGNNKKKFALPYPKHGPFPPDQPTVAYWPLPEHLDPHGWNFHQSPRPGGTVLRYFDIMMQRDARRRKTATYYGPLRYRLTCLKKNQYLPDEIKTVAAEEIVRLPKDSCQTRVKNRCIVTSRPRGKRPRWRLSRIIFRQIADHGKMSGMEKAFWDGGSQGHHVSLAKQTRKKKH